jgi:hypothetical protein
LFRVIYFFFLFVVVVGPTSPLIRGRVRLAPPVPAFAPITADLFAAGPSVTVLVQPDATKSSAPTVNVTNVFMFFLSSSRVLIAKKFYN